MLLAKAGTPYTLIPATNHARMIARVTLELALRKEFDYLIPPEFIGQVDVGSRVQVPFGPRKIFGCVTALAERSDHAKPATPGDHSVAAGKRVQRNHCGALRRYVYDPGGARRDQSEHGMGGVKPGDRRNNGAAKGRQCAGFFGQLGP